MADPQIRIIAGSLDKFTNKLIKKLALDITANLVEDTPVDTGWARANWVPSIGLPIVETAIPRDREDQISLVSGKLGEQQIGIDKIALSYSIEMGSIFISNNVPYILKLNEGTSRQAPSAFVQAAIARGVSNIGVGLA